MFFKDLIGKQIQNNQGEIVGYSRAGIFSKNRKKVTALLCADGNENDFLFPISKNTNPEALILPDGKRIKPRGEAYSPIRKPVYSTKGEYLGIVQDLRLKESEVLSVIVKDREFEVIQIRALGDCILIGAQPVSSVKKARNRPVLLGQILRYNICNTQGELIFSKGQVITPQTLKSALSHNKLLELTVKSLPLKGNI